MHYKSTKHYVNDDNDIKVFFTVDHNTCPLCYSTIEEMDDLELDCGHRFCFGCISKWKNDHNLCPQCDEPIDNEEQILLPYNEMDEEEDEDYEEINYEPLSQWYTQSLKGIPDYNEAVEQNDPMFGEVFNNEMYAFAMNYNVLRIMSGMGGLSYSN